MTRALFALGLALFGVGVLLFAQSADRVNETMSVLLGAAGLVLLTVAVTREERRLARYDWNMEAFKRQYQSRARSTQTQETIP